MNDKTLLILNGSGLADLTIGGDRHGSITLKAIKDECAALCAELAIDLEFRQTDNDDELIHWIAKDSENFGALIINPARSAKAGTVDIDRYRSAFETIAKRKKPFVEVHLTNIFLESAKSPWPIHGPEGEMGFVCGLGLNSYLLGIRAAASRLQS